MTWFDSGEDDFQREVLGLGTFLCIIMIIFYGASDSSPLHMTRRHEKIFLGIVFVMLMATIIIASGTYTNIKCYTDKLTQGSKAESCGTFSGTGLGIWRSAVVGIVFLHILLDTLPGPPQRFTGRLAQDSTGRASIRGKQYVITLTEILEDYRRMELKMLPGMRKFTPIGILLILADSWTQKNTSLALIARIMIFIMVIVIVGHFLRKANQSLHKRPIMRRTLAKVISKVVNVLEADELEHVLVTVNAAQLVECATRRALEALYIEARDKLTVSSRAVLLDALMKRSPASMRWERGMQGYVLELILSVKGENLTALKNIIDSSQNYYSLHKLIFKEIHSNAVRKRLLEHLMQEGKVVRQSRSHTPLKILSDIDDTLVCGGHFPAGCDKLYPRKVVYPGVLSFFAALDHCPEEALELSVNVLRLPQSLQHKLSHVSHVCNGKSSGITAAISLAESSQSSMVNVGGDAGGATGKTLGMKKSSSLGSIKKNSTPGTSPATRTPTGMNVQQTISGDVLMTPRSINAEEGINAEHLQVDTCLSVSQLELSLDRADTQVQQEAFRVLHEHTMPHITAEILRSGKSALKLRVEPHQVNLIFLSARPHLFQDLAEEHSYRLFRKLTKEGRMHAVPQLLSGNLGASLSAVLLYVCQKTSSWRMVGERKARTFEEYASLYPEYDYVFCGDNGQGDLLAAERILQGPWKEHIRGCFIHEVLPQERQLTSHPMAAPSEATGRTSRSLRDNRITFSRTYIAAAAKAFEMKLITLEELVDVMKSTVQEFVEIATLYPKWDSAAAMEILNEDLHAANRLIGNKEGVDPICSVNRADLERTLSLTEGGDAGGLC
eukprot:gnl/MRDRNA2_/MRDRNA2_28748_c0_seq1.p1 gnl/MRDRNA2_/MRDRNA2_28748_c0~~gnl/MRDRNA2_/MRDRNA2_28748_c0_seq1.p1  ORF type:complete len:838 (+),score=116.05 gnl/MRDRNA2_/MRDRNA2_28748_c0_seq1:211-2724(+)